MGAVIVRMQIIIALYPQGYNSGWEVVDMSANSHEAGHRTAAAATALPGGGQPYPASHHP
jgi:hypothetical protein